MLVCFYLGYVLYVVFPAAPPRLVLVFEFTKNLRGYSQVFSTLSAGAFALLPTDSRAAFPSLHTAVSTVALIYAWRYARPFFYVLVPFVLGLWASTIYLRHHYFVDLVAGWLLAPLAVWMAPHIEAFWRRQQTALGLSEPLLGSRRRRVGSGAAPVYADLARELTATPRTVAGVACAPKATPRPGRKSELARWASGRAGGAHRAPGRRTRRWPCLLLGGRDWHRPRLVAPREDEGGVLRPRERARP